MQLKQFSFLILSSSGLASPLVRRTGHGLAKPWDLGGTSVFPIHSSCNNTEVIQLRKHLNDMFTVANHAIDYILRFGNESALYTKWFGSAPTAEPIGWYERLIRADRTGFTFRCDDPDHYCGPPGETGYWRGIDVAPEDVNICPLAYTLIPLEALCSRGYTLSGSVITSVMVTDLMHRLLHVPSVTHLEVEHFANGYIGAVDLAKSAPNEAVRNSDSLQFFALEAYAWNIAAPGVGCVGDEAAARIKYEAGVSASKASATATATKIATATAAIATTDTASVTNSSGAACHTHTGGVVHCV